MSSASDNFFVEHQARMAIHLFLSFLQDTIEASDENFPKG